MTLAKTHPSLKRNMAARGAEANRERLQFGALLESFLGLVFLASRNPTTKLTGNPRYGRVLPGCQGSTVAALPDRFS